MRIFNLIILILFINSCKNQDVINKKESYSIYDSHVHIMSPNLVSYWKEMGIPFSKPAAYYSNIDTIIKSNGAEKIDLIGMGYVYGNQEYYQGSDGYQKLKEENDYLFSECEKHPNKIRPFFAVDPLKEYALDEFARCKDKSPKSGMKLHFSTSQVYLTEEEHLRKVSPLFERAAKNDTPILLHFDNWHPEFGRRDLEILMDSILSSIPTLELRIAHFGTSGGFNDKTKRFLDAYVELKKNNRIPTKHKILLDISAVALDKDSEGVSRLTASEFQELREYIDRIGVNNIIFGTDYPLYTSDDYINVLKKKLDFTDEEIYNINKS